MMICQRPRLLAGFLLVALAASCAEQLPPEPSYPKAPLYPVIRAKLTSLETYQRSPLYKALFEGICETFLEENKTTLPTMPLSWPVEINVFAAEQDSHLSLSACIKTANDKPVVETWLHELQESLAEKKPILTQRSALRAAGTTFRSFRVAGLTLYEGVLDKHLQILISSSQSSVQEAARLIQRATQQVAALSTREKKLWQQVDQGTEKLLFSLQALRRSNLGPKGKQAIFVMHQFLGNMSGGVMEWHVEQDRLTMEAFFDIHARSGGSLGSLLNLKPVRATTRGWIPSDANEFAELHVNQRALMTLVRSLGKFGLGASTQKLANAISSHLSGAMSMLPAAPQLDPALLMDAAAKLDMCLILASPNPELVVQAIQKEIATRQAADFEQSIEVLDKKGEGLYLIARRKHVLLVADAHQEGRQLLRRCLETKGQAALPTSYARRLEAPDPKTLMIAVDSWARKLASSIRRSRARREGKRARFAGEEAKLLRILERKLRAPPLQNRAFRMQVESKGLRVVMKS